MTCSESNNNKLWFLSLPNEHLEDMTGDDTTEPSVHK